MIVACAWEPVSRLLDEPGLQAMVEAYWQELSPRHDVLAFAPDWLQMIELESAGVFRVWACRVDGEIAGFIGWHIFRPIMYARTLWAVDGGHYLAGPFRDNGRIGWRMWKSAGVALEEMGVAAAMMHDNAKRPLAPFFLGLGAEPVSSTYLWVL